MTDERGEPFRAKHDLGGRESAEFTPSEHEPSEFDLRVDALVNILAAPDVGLVGPDERRLGIESLSDDEYHHCSYYQRWLRGVTAILVKKGILSDREIAERIEKLKAG